MARNVTRRTSALHRTQAALLAKSKEQRQDLFVFRRAQKELGSGTVQIARWFRELQYYGFIIKMIPGQLGVVGKGRAPGWRLTEVGYMRGTSSKGMEDMPTMDFLKWNGTPFSKRCAPRPKQKLRLVEGIHS
jgi:hypothetical protein